MTSRQATTPDHQETIARARAVRAEHAMAARIYTNRVEQARAAARYRAMAPWIEEYRRSAASSRQLGEIICSEREAA